MRTMRIEAVPNSWCPPCLTLLTDDTQGRCRAFEWLGFEGTLMRTKYPLLIIVATMVLSPGVFPVAGFSQAVFYQGKTLKIINNDPGGVVSLRLRTVTKYLSKYIPGHPTIIVEIMEGGGGRKAANYVFQNAKPCLLYTS